MTNIFRLLLAFRIQDWLLTCDEPVVYKERNIMSDFKYLLNSSKSDLISAGSNYDQSFDQIQAENKNLIENFVELAKQYIEFEANLAKKDKKLLEMHENYKEIHEENKNLKGKLVEFGTQLAKQHIEFDAKMAKKDRKILDTQNKLEFMKTRIYQKTVYAYQRSKMMSELKEKDLEIEYLRETIAEMQKWDRFGDLDKYFLFLNDLCL